MIDMLGGQPSVSTGAMTKALEQQTLNASVITKTLDKLNSVSLGAVAPAAQDYGFQKEVLSAAYADMGIGTRLNTVA